jgi:hypothetical protein
MPEAKNLEFVLVSSCRDVNASIKINIANVLTAKRR